MWKRYIVIYNGEAGSKSIFFDTVKNKLVVVEIGGASYKSTLFSGFLGVLIYGIFGNILFRTTLTPIVLVVLILIAGIFGGTFFNLLLNRVANSDKNNLEYLSNVSESELTTYLVEGKKQWRKNLALIMVLLIMLILSILPIYFGSHSLLLLLAAIFFITLVTFFIGVVSPAKRIRTYRYIEKNKQSMINNLKGEINL